MVSKNEYADKLRMLSRRGGRVWAVDKRSRLYSQDRTGHCNSDRKNAEARHCFPFWLCLNVWGLDRRRCLTLKSLLDGFGRNNGLLDTQFGSVAIAIAVQNIGNIGTWNLEVTIIMDSTSLALGGK